MFHKVMFGVWNACRFLRDTLFAIFPSQHGEDRREDPGCQDTVMTAVEQIHMDKKDNHPWGKYMINKCIAFSHAKAIKSIDLARSSDKYPVTYLCVLHFPIYHVLTSWFRKPTWTRTRSCSLKPRPKQSVRPCQHRIDVRHWTCTTGQLVLLKWHIYTLLGTNNWTLKINGWKISFLLWWPIFRR